MLTRSGDLQRRRGGGCPPVGPSVVSCEGVRLAMSVPGSA
jgi:hypothetical protein